MIKIKDFTIKEIPYQLPVTFFESISQQSYNALLTGFVNPNRAKFSYIGKNPYAIISYQNKIIKYQTEKKTTFLEENIWIFLKKMLELTDFKNLPSPANRIGWIGYLSYDLKNEIEEFDIENINNFEMPIFEFVLYNEYFVFDHRKNRCYQIKLKFDENSLIFSEQKFKKGLYRAYNFTNENTKSEYIEKIKKIKDYIYEGDIYEVNFTQQTKADFEGDSYSLFKNLLKINSSPFSAYLNFDTTILSNSPELFLEVNGSMVKTAPIKGTISRGKTEKEDLLHRKTLLNSQKDRAELNMIIDLLRNDIGKVCKFGSVKVTSKGHIEAYENVYHLVGEISGKLNSDIIDLIKATFPGGSITGCPKLRAMEIICELEKYKRNLYTGSVVLMNKNYMISNIVIRSMMIKNGQIVFNSGGAITIDSNPENEYEEYKIKLKSIAKALNYDSFL
jgi:para-aminobenzoate synthetase component 1